MTKPKPKRIRAVRAKKASAPANTEQDPIEGATPVDSMPEAATMAEQLAAAAASSVNFGNAQGRAETQEEANARRTNEEHDARIESYHMNTWATVAQTFMRLAFGVAALLIAGTFAFGGAM